MLKRDLLPFPSDAIPKAPNLPRWFSERWQDMRASMSGNLEDPLHIHLPRDDARMNFALAALLAVMLYVAALSIFAQYVMGHAAEGLDQSLQLRVTFEILPDTTRQDDHKSMQVRASALQQALKNVAGVKSANVISRDAMGLLLEPWLGKKAALDSLPLPMLLDVQLDPQTPASKKALEDAMEGLPGVTLDDHARFQGDLARLVGGVKLTASLVLALALAALMLTSYFAAEATFHMNRDVIELLHLIGADDRAVAQHMGLAVLRMALIAAGCALGLALLTLLGLWASGHQVDVSLFPNFSMSGMDWVILILSWIGMLGAAVLLCLLAARFTVLRALRRLL